MALPGVKSEAELAEMLAKRAAAFKGKGKTAAELAQIKAQNKANSKSIVVKASPVRGGLSKYDYRTLFYQTFPSLREWASYWMKPEFITEGIGL